MMLEPNKNYNEDISGSDARVAELRECYGYMLLGYA